MGGTIAKPRKGTVYKLRTGKACKNKWQAMNREVCRFLACDILATHTYRRSGATAEDFRADARKYYLARHQSEFKFETAYDFLKDKPKWLRDLNQHAKGDGKKKTRTTPAKPTEKLRTSDSENEGPGGKVSGQKKARRLEKDLVVITAAVVAKEAITSADIAKFQERARTNFLAVQVEQSRHVVEMEEKQVQREKQDDDIIMMDLTGMEEYKVKYIHERITDIFERRALMKEQKVAPERAEEVARQAAALAPQVACDAPC